MTDRNSTPAERLLRSALREADSAPGHVGDYARAAYGWRELDLDIASLVADSIADGLAGVRGGGKIRFSFAEPSGSNVELAYDVEAGSLGGLIDPPGSGACELITSGDRRTTDVTGGSFDFPDVPTGPVSIVARLDDGRSFKTEWMTL